MTLERRRALVELAQRYGVPILEDDCYVDLRFDGQLAGQNARSTLLFSAALRTAF